MLDFILTLTIGLVLGYRVSAHIHLSGFRQILKQLKISDQDLRRAIKKAAPDHWRERFDVNESEPEPQQPETVISVKLEQHHGEIYAFSKDTDTFLGQGKDGDALIQRLNETMKPCRVVISKEDGADLLQKNNT